MSKVKKVSSVEFLNAVSVKINELQAMFEDHDQCKSLIVIATAICPDDKGKVVVSLAGTETALVDSLSEIMKKEETKPLIQKAIEVANNSLKEKAVIDESIAEMLARVFGNK